MTNILSIIKQRMKCLAWKIWDILNKNNINWNFWMNSLLNDKLCKISLRHCIPNLIRNQSVFSFHILLERAKGDTDQWYSSSYAHFLIQPLCQRTFYHAITRILDATLISSLLMEDRKLCHICNHRLYARREFTSCSKLVLTLHKKNVHRWGRW